MNPESLQGQRVSVIGAGKSGIAAAELLLHAGALPVVSESGRIPAERVARLSELGIPFEQEGHSTRNFDTSLCIVSPGIPGTAAVLGEMACHGIPMVSEIELASWFCKGSVIGITGTDGKTTTATLMHRIAEIDGSQRGYRAFSVGNIGIPFSSRVADMGSVDLAVLELSSYQLERCFTFRPRIAVLTNITPDHMDRYGGRIEDYAEAKFRIHARQGEGDTVVYNQDDPILRARFDRIEPWPFRLVPFGIEGKSTVQAEYEAFVTVDDSGMVTILSKDGGHEIVSAESFMKPGFQGEHNLYNALACVAASHAAGIPPEAVRDALACFGGVAHRQEFAGSACGLLWINDSKATTVNAMCQAIRAVPAGMVLIAGGRDKGNDYSVITALVRERVAHLIATGESQEKLAAAFNGVVPVSRAGSLGEATAIAARTASPGTTVLFSPGCSSFDMFSNFEERGDHFKQLVRELAPC